MMKKVLAAAVFGFGLLLFIGFASFSDQQGAAQATGEPQVVSALGVAQVQGQDAIVEVIVVVPAGADAHAAAAAALAEQGARPFESANLGSEGFTLTGLVWNNLPVVQNYNRANEPANVNGQTALTNTHGTWDGVATSSFDIDFGVITDRCPSLVRECPGPQFFDGFNDVAWLKLRGGVLGVTWFGTSTDEADIALSTRFSWNDGCVDVADSFDAETVFLHENGHVVGLGHSDDLGSVMQRFYHGADCDLGTDDQEGATFLYDTDITSSVSGTVTDEGGSPIGGATVVLEDTGLSATTAAEGTYTISGAPDPVTYTVTASADGFDSATISRLTVDGATAANFTLTAAGGEEDDDGGGPPACVPKRFC